MFYFFLFPYLFPYFVITLIYNCTAIVFNLIECASSIVHEFLSREGPELLHMRIKHLMKQKHMEKAARLAKTCAEFPEFGGKKNFKQIYLVCLCEIKPQEELMQEVRVFKKSLSTLHYCWILSIFRVWFLLFHIFCFIWNYNQAVCVPCIISYNNITINNNYSCMPQWTVLKSTPLWQVAIIYWI